MKSHDETLTYRAQADRLANDHWKVSLWDDSQGKCLQIITRHSKRSAIRAARRMVRWAKFRAGEKRWWSTRILSKS